MPKIIAITIALMLSMHSAYKHWKRQHNEYLLACMHQGKMKDDCEND